MSRVIKRLDSIHEKVLKTVTSLSEEVFCQSPSENAWSVGEIIQHLALVEERVTKDLERSIEGAPRRVRFIKRLVPTSIVTLRLLRVKAPKAVNPIAVPEKEVAIENLNRARGNLKTLFETHGEERFRQLVFKHPFLGEIDGVATVSFVGYHEQRHYKQIREVLKKIGS